MKKLLVFLVLVTIFLEWWFIYNAYFQHHVTYGDFYRRIKCMFLGASPGIVAIVLEVLAVIGIVLLVIKNPLNNRIVNISCIILLFAPMLLIAFPFM